MGDGAATCESCGKVAEVSAAGGYWCMGCHVAALHLGYDVELGVLLISGAMLTWADLEEEERWR